MSLILRVRDVKPSIGVIVGFVDEVMTVFAEKSKADEDGSDLLVGVFGTLCSFGGDGEVGGELSSGRRPRML